MPRKKPKIMVDKITCTNFVTEWSYHIDEIINYFNKWKEEGWERVSFFARDESEINFNLIAKRLETDEEYKVRMDIEERSKKWQKERKARQEENDRKLYERLKKRFENDNQS
jgi:hypothetical protein